MNTRMQKPTLLPSSIAEAGVLLRSGRLKVFDLVQACRDQIHARNQDIRALITVTDSQALATSRLLDAELSQKLDRGPLHGIPIVHKDLYDTAGVLTTMGSALYRLNVPEKDATVVKKLKDAGTVMLGKSSLPEFATHPSGRNQFYGTVRNPIDPKRSAGGSSGGTAAAITAGMCLGGTGSDTGGSIRIPASWCGIVGVRPTFGLVSMDGAHARAHSFDVCGPMARTVTDCALLLNAMVGYDPAYKFSRQSDPVDYTQNLADGIKGLRLGVIDNFTYANVDADVGVAIREATKVLEKFGARVVRVQCPLLGGSLDYRPLFDILLYEFNEILGGQIAAANGALFGPVVIDNIARGKTVSAEAYRRALTMRPKHLATFQAVFKEVDALLTPTVPMVAPNLMATEEVWTRTRQFTLPFSYLGLPCISVPSGISSSGMPVGLQIIANEFQEALILRIAAAYEKACATSTDITATNSASV